MARKIIVFLISFILIFEQSGFAQVAAPLGIPAYLNGYLNPDRFRPMHLRSLSYDALNNNFNILLDKGDIKDLKPVVVQDTTQKLLEYFKIGISLPNSMFWVNLRPDSEKEIIDPDLEKTDLGKVLLEADLQMKKDLANLTSPDNAEGRLYWDRLYAKAEAMFGRSDIEIPTLTRPWIVPGEIIIRQNSDTAYVYKATLKVMLEQDYLKDTKGYEFDDPRLKELNEFSSDLIRKLIIPKLARQVNSSKKYSQLRQVYYSLILAQWFKQQFRGKQGEYSSQIDKKDLTGLTSKIAWSKDTYFKAYQKSFKNGEYDRQDTYSDVYGGLSIRRYCSGGIIPVANQGEIVTISKGSNQVAGPDLLGVQIKGNEFISQDLTKAIADGGTASVKDGSSADLAVNKPDNILIRPFVELWRRNVNPILADRYIKVLNNHRTERNEREEAARKLGELGDNRAIKHLKRYLVEVVLGDKPDVTTASEDALRKLGLNNRDIERIYLKAFKDRGFHRLIRLNAVKVLGNRVGRQLSFEELPQYQSGETDMIVKRAIDEALPKISKRLKEDSTSRDGGDTRENIGIIIFSVTVGLVAAITLSKGELITVLFYSFWTGVLTYFAWNEIKKRIAHNNVFTLIREDTLLQSLGTVNSWKDCFRSYGKAENQRIADYLYGKELENISRQVASKQLGSFLPTILLALAANLRESSENRNKVISFAISKLGTKVPDGLMGILAKDEGIFGETNLEPSIKEALIKIGSPAAASVVTVLKKKVTEANKALSKKTTDYILHSFEHEIVYLLEILAEIGDQATITQLQSFLMVTPAKIMHHVEGQDSLGFAYSSDTELDNRVYVEMKKTVQALEQKYRTGTDTKWHVSNRDGGDINAAVEAVTIGKSEVPRLVEALSHPDSRIRIAAAQELDRLEELTPERKLIRYAADLTDPEIQVRLAATEALKESGELTDERQQVRYVEDLTDPDIKVRNAAVDGLAKLNKLTPTLMRIKYVADSIDLNADPEVRLAARTELTTLGKDAVPLLVEALSHPDSRIRIAAAQELDRLEELTPERQLIRYAADVTDPDIRVRLAATEALGKISDPKAVKSLLKALSDPDIDVSRTAAEALVKIRDPRVVKLLLRDLVDPDKDVRLAAAEALKGLGELTEERQLIRFVADLDDPDKDVRLAAAVALGKIGSSQAVDGLGKALDDPDRDVALAAVEALKNIGHPRAIQHLHGVLGKYGFVVAVALQHIVREVPVEKKTAFYIEDLANLNGEIQLAAVEGLVRIGQPAVASLLKALSAPYGDVRRAATEALVKIGQPAVALLLKVLTDPNSNIRRVAAEVLGNIGDQKATDLLLKALEDIDKGVGRAAAAALVKIGKPAVPRLVELSRDAVIGPQVTQILGQIGSNEGKKDGGEVSVTVQDFEDFANNKDKLKDRFIDKNFKQDSTIKLFDFGIKSALRTFKDAKTTDTSLIKSGSDRLYADKVIEFLRQEKNKEGVTDDREKRDGGQDQKLSIEVAEALRHVRELAQSRRPIDFEQLQKYFNDRSTDPLVRIEIAKNAIVFSNELAVPLLMQASIDQDDSVRQMAVRYLGLSKDPSAIEAIIEGLSDPNDAVKMEAEKALNENFPEAKALVAIQRDTKDGGKTEGMIADVKKEIGQMKVVAARIYSISDLINITPDKPLVITADDGETIEITYEMLQEFKKTNFPKVLQEYDARGKDGFEDKENPENFFTKEVLVLLGISLATAEFASHHGLEHLNAGDVYAMAGDNGPTTPKFRKYLSIGLRAAGINVLDLGLINSGQLYSSIPRLGLQGGLYVTRSHVEVGTNGFKPIVGKTTLYGDMMQELGKQVDKGLRIVDKNDLGVLIDGTAKDKGIGKTVKDIYVAKIKEENGPVIQKLKEKNIPFAVDLGSGSATTLKDIIKDIFGDNVLTLRDTPVENPTKITGLADPSRTDKAALDHPGSGKDNKSLLEWSKENPGLIIFSFDLDMDRMGIVISGKLYKGDLLFYPMIEYLLTLAPKGTVNTEFYYDPRMSPAIRELIEHFGGISTVHPKGHSKIKASDETTLIDMAQELGYPSVEEMILQEGFKIFNIESSLHPFITIESGVSIDDAFRFMFAWLDGFLKIRDKYDRQDMLLGDYIEQLQNNGVINKWESLNEQRTGLQDKYKKSLMTDWTKEVVKAFGADSGFEQVFWRDAKKQTKPFTLIDIEGVFNFKTPLGDFYWGWSNASEKIGFGAHAQTREALKFLTKTMLAVFLHLRNSKADLDDKSKQIDALETKPLLELFGKNDISTLESEILAEYPTIDKALDSLKQIAREGMGTQTKKDGGTDKEDAVSKSGGIDFRALPVGGTAPNIAPVLTPLPEGYISASAEELEKKWKDIKHKIQAGPMPYGEIKEYVTVCCQGSEAADRLKQASIYILDLLRLEEDAAVATAPELKEILSCLG